MGSEPGWHRAWIGLGGNIGDVRSNLKEAVINLGSLPKVTVRERSPVYKTPPWGITDQDWFLNACIEVQTSFSPVQLLEACLSIETALNRKRDVRWGPRTIDLDILIYEGLEMHTDALTLPHPRMHERGFVMKPLSDIAPDLLVRGTTVHLWMERLDISEIVEAEPASFWGP